MRLVLVFLLAMSLAAPVAAQDGPGAPEGAMTMERMGAILTALDPEARRRGTRFELTLADVPVLVVADPAADRMRAMVPIRRVEGMDAGEMLRVMQANFDSALDARYAVAQGRLWSVYIHPLGALERDQLISGLGQAVNVAASYGTTYSGGALAFGGGDGAELRRRALIDELLRRGRDI